MQQSSKIRRKVTFSSKLLCVRYALKVTLSCKVRTWSGSSHFSVWITRFWLLHCGEKSHVHDFVMCWTLFKSRVTLWCDIWAIFHIKIFSIFLLFLWLVLPSLLESGLYYLCPDCSKLVLLLKGYLMDISPEKSRHLSWVALIASWMDGCTSAVLCF